MEEKRKDGLMFHGDGSLTKLGWTIFILGFLLVCKGVSLLSGCCNIGVRSRTVYTSSAPEWCSPHPYFCTQKVFEEAVSAPWRTLFGGTMRFGERGIGDAWCTVTWPFWAVDELFEIAADTLFLPVDAVYVLAKDDNPQDGASGEEEKIEEVMK